MEGPFSVIVCHNVGQETLENDVGLFSASAWTYHMTLPSAKGLKSRAFLGKEGEPESGE